MQSTSVFLAVLLFSGLLGGPVAAAAELNLLSLKKPDPVPTKAVKARPDSRTDEAARHAWKKPPKVAWPEPGIAKADLTKPVKAQAGSLPARLSRGAAAGSLAEAQVQILDRATTEKLGVDGVVLAVRPTKGVKGDVDVQVDYSGFRDAYGGDWASRLTLRQLPGCALVTPVAKNCGTGRVLKTANNTSDATLTASVELPAPDGTASNPQAPVAKAPAALHSATGLSAAQDTVLLAATAGPSGASGDFKATSLAPSASWSAGGNNGGFSWTYDIKVPEVPGGLEPDLDLSYSSQSIDGRTAATNNQANWIGDGWSLDPGYVERRYVSCVDDTTGSNTTAKVGDLCWKKDNAVLNLGGKTNTLVKDDTTGEWHLQNDDGTQIEKLTSSTINNKDNDGEYWRVTTPDGTRYYFGYNHPNGWAAGKDETNSTWTVPVYGNQSGEPCHAAAFADSWCQQAWRWNLDAVIDPHGDAITYYWAKEANSYGRNVNATTGASTATAYDRGGYLKRIEYGLRAGDFYGKAAAKAEFGVSERCLTDCATFDKNHAPNWPDVPFDQYCATGTECKDKYSPSFWTRMRLTTIDTSVLVGGAYKPVDSWALTQQFPATNDGTTRAMWLASITRTGHTGTGDASLPPVTFKGQPLANRVEGATTGGNADPVPQMIRYRVYGIDTETGGTIGITYSAADCKAGDVPSPSSNARRCYPVMWSPPDSPGDNYEPYLDWFHSYVATQVLEQDNTGGAPAKETDYAYLDGVSWGKDEDEFTKSKYLTYGSRRGYGRVQVRNGAGSDARTLREYRYFRGIDGADVKDHEGVAATDHPAFAGMAREEATFNGDGGKLLSTTAYAPWHSAATATQARTGLSAMKAYVTAAGSEKSRTLVGSGWRTTETDRTFDGNGQILTESRLGDTTKSGDEECTTTTYAKNTSANILDLIAETQTVAVACDTTPSLPDDLIATKRNFYDGAGSLTAAPTAGDVTRLDEQDDTGTGYLTTKTRTYDQYGRVLTEADALGNTTTTAYTPKTGEAPTSSTDTNALGHTTTTEHDPARGVTTGTVDPNGKRTDVTYDGLGRVLNVWKPGWAKAAHATQPSAQYSYNISQTMPSSVTSKTLKRDGSYAASYTIYDGLLRQRETQSPATGTQDRIVTETLYDTRGWTRKTYSAYYTSGAPSTTLVAAADNTVPAATQNLYDGTGRVTDAIAVKFGDEQWRTKTAYDGDRTTVIPPLGGTAGTTVTDALGRTTERIQYTNADRSASQTTTYTYGKQDQPEKITDPAGNEWTFSFDARGRQIKADDPDKGLSTVSYDKADRAVSSTDARGVTLTSGYDKLGRKIELKQGATTLATWTYDTVAKGQLTSSTRYVGGAEYTTANGGFTDSYQPTSTTVSIPTTAGGLAGSYTWTYGYNNQTGLPDWTLHPAIGDIPSERVTTNYNSDDLPIRTSRAGVVLAANTTYDVYSRPVRTEFGDVGKKVYKSQAYDEFTGRMMRQTTDRDLAPQRIDDTSYNYDPSGNVTGITTASGQDTAKSTDTQCFTSDALGRLTEAWTATADCTAAPSSGTVGGPDAYWQTYGYDAIGNRTKLTEHGTGTQAGSDAVTTYTQPAAKTGLPHAVQQADVKGGTHDGQTSTFAYDKAGNTTQRKIGSDTQNLTWDAEGHLATLTEAGKTTSYLYDADDDRLIAKNADGTSTLTLPAGNELKLNTDGSKAGTRYYTHNSETVAVRTGSDISYLFSDRQGTALTAVAVGSLAITRRKQLPFGQDRSTQAGAFPGTRGFVGGTTDPTGLTHLGAREYDAALGRFISVDPLLITDDPRQHNAYAYSNNNPVTFSDPTGERLEECASGQYTCTHGGTRPTGYGKNYEMITHGRGGTLAPDYVRYKQRMQRACHHDPDCKSWDGSHRGNAARAKERAAAEAARKKAEAERRKKDGIFGSLMKGHFSDAWDSSGGKVVSGVADAAQAIGARNLTQFAIGVGSGFIAGIAAGAACAGTAGLACVVIAGAVIGSLTATPANLAVDKAFGHKTTGPESVGYLASNSVRGGFQGAFRALTGQGPATYYFGQAWNRLRRR
ncbi:RHS repeat domain-containing protein [Streptomyces melanogenes]|uniref:RHS repeat domain-containing protein n=1 Tax=Streptomyces melanogenes TaxID=67326 RepID=UPI0019C4C0F2|nr:RHS repeat-associated core domain-containing protein [Streptomyces melanogenes]GGP43700.1 hypothetical protein GCM10010278_20370 [Streptomyces melanogenes]